jgi:hypothetical protein
VPRESLLDEQLQRLSDDAECDADYALYLIRKLMDGLPPDQLKGVFDRVLTVLFQRPENPQPFLAVLESAPRHLGDLFTQRVFRRLIGILDPILMLEPAVTTRFFTNILDSLSPDMQFDLLQMICQKDSVPRAVSEFLSVLYRAMNKSNREIDAPGVEQLWDFFFRTEEARAADLLISIYLGSGNPNFAKSIIARCFEHLESPAVPRATHMLVDGFDGSLGLDQRESPANRFVFEEEFVRISFCGDVPASLSLLYDSSFDRVLSTVAFLADCRPEHVTLSARGRRLRLSTFTEK